MQGKLGHLVTGVTAVTFISWIILFIRFDHFENQVCLETSDTNSTLHLFLASDAVWGVLFLASLASVLTKRIVVPRGVGFAVLALAILYLAVLIGGNWELIRGELVCAHTNDFEFAVSGAAVSIFLVWPLSVLFFAVSLVATIRRGQRKSR
jgi:hypothetical protein